MPATLGCYRVVAMCCFECCQRRIVTTGAQRTLILLEQCLMIASMCLVTHETVVLGGSVHDRAVEFRLIMAAKAELARLVLQEAGIVSRMRIVANRAVAAFRRCVNVPALHPQAGLVMALITEGSTGLRQPQHADETMWLVAGKAFLLPERLVFELSLEVTHGVAIKAVALAGKPLPPLYLRQKRTSGDQPQSDREPGDDRKL